MLSYGLLSEDVSMIRTEDSLNCPCNGIYKCGFHSIVPKRITIIPNDRIHLICKSNEFVSPSYYGHDVKDNQQ